MSSFSLICSTSTTGGQAQWLGRMSKGGAVLGGKTASGALEVTRDETLVDLVSPTERNLTMMCVHQDEQGMSPPGG